MHSPKKISVLIPCYNQSKHIRKVVEAVINQTLPPDEIIVVDDASQDDSVEILRQLCVRLICHPENRGPAITRNTALHAASGDIVVFIDSDAYADRRMIEMLLKAYDSPSRRSLGGVGGRGIEDNILTVYDRWRTIHARQDFGSLPRDQVPYLFGLCMSFRREALLKVNGFDPFYPINAGEDLDVGYRLNNAGYQLRYTPEAVVYHQHSDTEEKLKSIQYNWFFWSYLAKRRTGFHPWMLFAGTLRRLITDTLADLMFRHAPELAKLDLEIFLIKIKAMRAASHYQE